MNAALLLVMICGVSAALVPYAQAQEIQLATFQETAQVIVDPSESGAATASITLQSSSSQEIKIPPGLEARILSEERIVAVIVTNEQNCILGVSDESCILINVQRGDDWEGITETQNETKKIGDAFIGDMNGFLDTDARFHSVFLHTGGGPDSLGVADVVSGANTVSAVYTMPMEATDSMYEKISALLLDSRIRESGGFYDAARMLASDGNASMTFAIIPQDPGALYQLILSVSTDTGRIGPEIRPLEFLGSDEISRSEYFADGFYPLNSLIQVVVLGANITGTEPGYVDTEVRGGVTIPSDLTQSGWISGHDSGGIREVLFLFGEETSVKSRSLSIALESRGDVSGGQDWQEPLVIIGIIAAAAGAAAFFLNGYKRPPR